MLKFETVFPNSGHCHEKKLLLCGGGPLARSHVVKQVLLRVAAVRPEMTPAEMPQTWQLRAALWKIKLLQRLDDPDIHREGLLKSVSEEQHAIGDFGAHARQGEQSLPRFFQRPPAQPGQIHLPRRQFAGRAGQIRGAEAQLAGAQFRFGSGGQPLHRRKGPGGLDARRERERRAEFLGQQPDDLLNLHDFWFRSNGAEQKYLWQDVCLYM